MGCHHEHEIKIPKYRICKVDNVPELVKVKNILATEGLQGNRYVMAKKI